MIDVSADGQWRNQFSWCAYVPAQPRDHFTRDAQMRRSIRHKQPQAAADFGAVRCIKQIERQVFASECPCRLLIFRAPGGGAFSADEHR